MIRIQVTKKGPYLYGRVLDEAGNMIGDANSYTYGGGAWAIQSKTYAGHMPFDSPVIEYVGRLRP